MPSGWPKTWICRYTGQHKNQAMNNLIQIFLASLPKLPFVSRLLAVALIMCFSLSNHAFAQLALDSRLLQQENWIEGDRPLQLKALGGIKYDSNLFRISDDPDPQTVIGSPNKDDYIYRLGVGVRYGVEYSRQKFVLDGQVDGYRYQNFDNLNNVSNNLRGEWKWQVGNFWDGNLGLGHRHYLSPFADVQQNVKDMIDHDSAYGSANYAVHSHLRLTLDLSADDQSHSADSRQSLDSKINTRALTVNWVTPAQNTVGLRYRTSDARYPNQQIVAGSPVDNAYRDNEYSLVARWFATGASDIQFRVGHIERDFDTASNRNFSGPTWRLDYGWRPPGKMALALSIWQELAPFEDLTSNYARTTGISAIPNWSITQQVTLQATAAYQMRKYLGDPGIAPIVQRREDKEQLYQVATIWTPARQTNLTFAVETGRRTSNQALADYNYQLVSVLASRTF